jgi:hypothetical protein
MRTGFVFDSEYKSEIVAAWLPFDGLATERFGLGVLLGMGFAFTCNDEARESANTHCPFFFKYGLTANTPVWSLEIPLRLYLNSTHEIYSSSDIDEGAMDCLKCSNHTYSVSGSAWRNEFGIAWDYSLYATFMLGWSVAWSRSAVKIEHRAEDPYGVGESYTSSRRRMPDKRVLSLSVHFIY